MGALFSFCHSLFLPFCHSLFLPFCHFDRSGEIRHAVPTKGGVSLHYAPRTEVAGVILPVRGAPMQKCCPRTEAAGVILPVRGAPMQKCCPRTEAAGVILPVRGEWRRGHPAAQPPYSIIFSMHFTAARRVSSSMTISSPPLPLRHARTSTSVVERMLLHTRSFESA